MTTKRPWHPTKADWAEARAAELLRRARELPVVPSSNWRDVRSRARAQASYRAEARRFELLAAKLREKAA